MNANETLARMEARANRNQAVADRILAMFERKGIRLGIGVSAEGLHFFDHVEFSANGAVFAPPSEQAMAELSRMGIGTPALEGGR